MHLYWPPAIKWYRLNECTMNKPMKSGVLRKKSALKTQFIVWWCNVSSLYDDCVLQAWVSCRGARSDIQHLGNYSDMDEERWIVSHNAVYKGTWLKTFCAFLNDCSRKIKHSILCILVVLYFCACYIIVLSINQTDIMACNPSMPPFAYVMVQ